ncbi:MAG: SpoIIE family protein phosphatase [Deltaproteobacteria bacterium]|nr:SpoIIE family protein phosphatase [Deltaproteobacteria bacterium]
MAASKRKLQIRSGLILGATILAYLCYALIPQKFQSLDSRVIDELFVLRSQAKSAHQPMDDRIVHIDANFYFSRSQHARILRNLSAMGVAAQLIDFIFADMVSQEEDQPLIRASRDTGNVYYGLNFASLELPSNKHKQLAQANDSKTTAGQIWPMAVEDNGQALLVGTRPQVTYPALASAAKGIGFLNLPVDPDGTLRRLPLVVRHQGAYIPSLSLRVMADFMGVSAANIIVNPGKSVRLRDALSAGGEIAIPIDEHGRMILDITGSVENLRHYSYSEISQVPENTTALEKLKTELAGKIAIISETVEKKYKVRAAAKEEFFSSGTIHTMVLQNLLSGSYLRELPALAQLAIEIVLLCIIFFSSIRFASPSLSLATFAITAVYIVLATMAFVYAGIIFQFVRPVLLLLTTLAFLLVGLGIEKAVLFSRSERARKIAERDLEIGREIQAGFFPTVLPQTEGWELATHFQAARHVAGDFYDIFTLGKDNKIAIVIADVCDKGVGAALFMALFRSFIRVLSGSAGSDGHLDMADPDTTPGKILQHTIDSINNYISITHEQAGMFATIFYGILDPRTAELTYINGGHEPPLIRNPNGTKTYLAPTGPAVGLYPDLDFNVRSVTLAPDDMLLVYTDGVTDARNKAGDAFTKKQLLKLVGNSSRTAQEMVSKIKSRISEHISDEDQFDDITIVALRRK